MNEQVQKVADAVLYEGHMLYPYRASSVKNRQRFNFGVVYPGGLGPADGSADGAAMQTECIVRGDISTRIDITLRFLQIIERTLADAEQRPVSRLEVGERVYLPWQEAKEREVVLQGCTLGALLEGRSVGFAFPESEETEPILDAAQRTLGTIVRRQRALVGELECVGVRCGENAFTIRVLATNHTTAIADGHPREELLPHSLVSVHTVLTVVRGSGEFISLTDPPASLGDAAAACRNVRTWPVLVGEPGERDTMLSSPIIIADYPQIAPESAGDLFDGTEIDEILSLRIMTLTDAEQREMSQTDERARLLLERSQALAADQLMKMHGTMRPPSPSFAEPP